MKKIVRILTIALMLSAALPAGAQEVRHGSDDFKIGIAGYSYRKFNYIFDRYITFTFVILARIISKYNWDNVVEETIEIYSKKKD